MKDNQPIVIYSYFFTKETIDIINILTFLSLIKDFISVINEPEVF